MEFLSKKDFLNLVDAYCKEVGRKHIENLYFLFSCGYTAKEAKETKPSLEIME